MPEGPFAPPSTPGAARGSARAGVAFLIRRGVLHLVLPGLAAAATLVHDGAPRWALAAAIFAAGTLVWAPTTIGLTWTRFFAPVGDPRPVVLADASLLSRSAYTRFQALSLAELVLMLVALVAVAAQLAAFAPWTWPLLPFAILLAAWAAWRARDLVTLSGAVVAHAASASDLVLTRAGTLLNRRSALGDTARVLVAHAHLRQGHPDAALEVLSGVRSPVSSSADLLAAQVLLGRGDTAPARRALATARRETPGVVWAREVVHAHLHLSEGRADAVLSRAETAWPALRTRWPAPWVASLDLMTAAAHHQRGDADAAARAAAQIPDLEDRAWMARVWPDTFGWLPHDRGGA